MQEMGWKKVKNVNIGWKKKVDCTCNHSHKLVAIMCISPNLAKAPCLVSSISLLLRNMKCICAVTKRSLAAGVIALNGPDATSAPICKPVKTSDPAPNPTVPRRRQKLPYCCVWWRCNRCLGVSAFFSANS